MEHFSEEFGAEASCAGLVETNKQLGVRDGLGQHGVMLPDVVQVFMLVSRFLRGLDRELDTYHQHLVEEQSEVTRLLLSRQGGSDHPQFGTMLFRHVKNSVHSPELAIEFDVVFNLYDKWRNYERLMFDLYRKAGPILNTFAFTQEVSDELDGEDSVDLKVHSHLWDLRSELSLTFNCY